MTEQNLKQLHSIASAVEVLGICRSTVYDLINSGEIKAKKFGNRTLIPSSELERWIANLPEHNPQEGNNG